MNCYIHESSPAVGTCVACGKPVCQVCLNKVNGKMMCDACVSQRPTTSKSRIAAALLAFFLGSLGVHKFYLGKIGQGFLYLLFCWTLIPGIVAFVEFIIYLTWSDEQFAAKYPDNAA